jgi:hypothetical protein
MSKKLEQNGLWESSRMMLPEHRQALIDRTQPERQERPNVPTREELGLIRSYALLPILLSIVETSARSVEASTSPLKKLFRMATHVLMNLIHADLMQVKKELKSRKIKVYEDEKIDGGIRYRFICRGYEDNFALIRDVVRAEVSVKLGEYIRLMSETLKGEKSAP